VSVPPSVIVPLTALEKLMVFPVAVDAVTASRNVPQEKLGVEPVQAETLPKSSLAVLTVYVAACTPAGPESAKAAAVAAAKMEALRPRRGARKLPFVNRSLRTRAHKKRSRYRDPVTTLINPPTL